MDTLPVREQKLTPTFSRDYEIARTSYKSLLDKRTTADMATDLERRQQGERFTMIDPAQPRSNRRAGPSRLGGKICCAFALGLAVVIGLARDEAQCIWVNGSCRRI